MRHFCTYFDRAYQLQGLALYSSLRQHAGPFRLWVLCLDQATYDVLTELALPDLEPVSLAALERIDPELLATRPSRSRVEYYFTATPSWVRYVLDHSPEGAVVTYLDADLFFFSDPLPLFEEFGAASVMIVEHRFAEEQKKKERFGKYNVGLVAFRRDDAGLSCLYRWREQCLDWCYDRVEEGRYADQKYLDDWPERFGSALHVLQHKGGGFAPWNLNRFLLSTRNGALYVDDDPLVFFHFHGLKPLNRWLYDAGIAAAPLSRPAREYIYAPYLRAVENAAAILTRHNTRYRVRYQDQRYGWSFLQRCAAGAVQRRLLVRLRGYASAIPDRPPPLS